MTGDGTRCVRAGLPAARPGEPLLPGPVFAAPFHLDPADPTGADTYARTDNPTRRLFEAAVGELEGGTAVAYASGLAAVTGALLAVLAAGDTVVLPADGYHSTPAFGVETLAPLGVRVRTAPTAGPVPALDGVRLVLVEAPANPGLDLPDLAGLVAAARAAGTLVAVDSTAATPLGLRPLDHGADLVLASGTKALSGHSDLLIGYAATRDPELAALLRARREHSGAVPGPFDCWLAHRSLATLDLRLARQGVNAAAVAALLAARPEVTGVRWPGLPTDPAYDRARELLRRPPGLVAAVFPDAAHVTRLLRHSRLAAAATSFGGLHTTVDRRAVWGDHVPPGFVRISCGIEDTADLVADLTDALDAAGTGP
ncbi:putative cystathionine gamma-lyase [Pilimelia terevasa]|uniref:Putative cystathionine gamma-lyase n=1 Tax=Pilimelia terevasa TaxID=53372 RepID=A0A8J3FI55_9ACTN|nr:cystathionine gamma-lyase [Pilimelia terevasa]GGK28443.1 putative cystathionine gamma-lyase [Pilimelia terevasa]